MRHINKKLQTVISLLLILCMTVSVGAASSSPQSWYCKRNQDNKQPPIASEFSYITLHNAYWIDNSVKDGDAQKVAYLTFDAGYENGNVEKILDILKEAEVPGAFFILANLIDRNPELVKRMSNEGHLVCNHTARHKDMTTIREIDEFNAELKSLEEKYFNLTGKNMSKYYRPPEGKFSEENLVFAHELGYKTIFWSFAYADWDNSKQMSASAAKEKVLKNIHNGCVLLLHPTSATNAAILSDVINEMKSLGYRFGTLDELCENVSVG